jgi:hypothetical protein
VTDLQVNIDANAAGSGNKVEILDNNESMSPPITCTVPAGSKTCNSTASATIAADHYLTAKVTELSGAQHRQYKVMIRY